MSKLAEVLREVLEDDVNVVSFMRMRRWPADKIYVEVLEVAQELGVPARRDSVKNFLAAYFRVKYRYDAKTVDRCLANSSTGRRQWETWLRLYFKNKKPESPLLKYTRR